MRTTENSKSTTSVSERVCRTAFHILGDKSNFHTRKENERLLNGETCTYTLSLSDLPGHTLLVEEQILPHHRDHYTHRHWIFEQDLDQWKLVKADKNSTAVGTEIIDLELLDLLDRLEAILHKSASRFEMPVPVDADHQNSFHQLMNKKSSRVFTLAAAGLIMAGLFLTIFISTMQYGRMLKTVYMLNESIQDSSEQSRYSINKLTGELAIVNKELDGIKSEIFHEKEAFLFNRKQTAMNLRWLSSQFPRSSSSRKKAYLFLADEVDEALTYGDVFFHMSRLPENNAQAETLMATNRDNYLSMNHYNPVFSGMKLPVSTGTRKSDESLFMISSGFIERRLSPLGYGGVKPHHAVDLINLDNIVRISDENEIIRDESIPGLIVSAYEGTILDAGFDYVYGWHVEVRHEVNDEVLASYPGAKFWSTFYAHMQDPITQALGQSVSQGDPLGDIGNSGRSTGPHLHFEVRIYRPQAVETSPFGNFEKINPYEKMVSE